MSVPLDWATKRLETVCQILGVRWAEVVGSSRQAPVVRARRLGAYVLREWRGPAAALLAFSDVGAAFRKSESSAIKLHAAVQRNAELKAEAERLADLMGLVKRRTLLDKAEGAKS